jgi:short-subunit dehydrogenase
MCYGHNCRETLRRHHLSFENKEHTMSTALITGASSGIGAIYADRLARRGFDLVLVARNEDRLEKVAATLRAETGRSIATEIADLGAHQDVQRIEHLVASNDDISILVNNAGVGSTSALVDSDVEDMERMIAVNVTALTRLTYAFVPAAVRRGEGTVINIGSVVGIAPEFLNGVYGATKAYVLALTQSLHSELADSGVQVQAVLPNATATGFWSAAGSPLGDPSAVMSAEDLVDAALIDLDQHEPVSIPPLHDEDQWKSYDAARDVLKAHFGASTPAPRYAKA